MKTNRRDFILKSMGITAGIPLTLHLPQYPEFTAIESPKRSALQNEKVTISVGVATLQPNSDIEISTLISEADAALYQAKANGRNCVVTTSNLLTYSILPI
mgnify:CR=1 FL=1